MKMKMARRRKENDGDADDKKGSSFGKTSGEPKSTGEKYPEGTTHTVRKIKNGFIKQTSYRHPETKEYVSEEVYHEKDPFGHVKGIA